VGLVGSPGLDSKVPGADVLVLRSGLVRGVVVATGRVVARIAIVGEGWGGSIAIRVASSTLLP